MKRKQIGVVTVEFSISIFFILILFMFYLEVNRYIYTLGFVEHAVSETSRYVKEYPAVYYDDDYDQVIKEILDNDIAPWNLAINGENIDLSYLSFNNLSDFPDNMTSECDRCKYAYYTISYQYESVFLPNTIKSELSRSVIVNQEHEGWRYE
ncbi:TadE/TadG family type IV pilus assembly protein [Vibrio paucivorans]